MFFYNEYTQNKEFGFGGFILKTLLRYLPVLLYLMDFSSAITNSTLNGGNGCELVLVVLILWTGIMISKPTIHEESMSASFRHRDIFAQILAFLYSGGYLGLLIYVIYTPAL
jgi:hypothetical protein